MAKTAGIGNDVLPLPSGGGSMKPIDETFKTDLGTGTGTYQIPLKFPKGVNDFTPKLNLKYSTGRGNGPFGIGWGIDIPVITRSTGTAIPSFDDDEDVFLFEGRELVHVGNNIYRPLIENEFSLITKTNNGWNVKTKTGIQLNLGSDENSRHSFNDDEDEKIYAWFLNEMIDNNGSTITYSYEKNGSNIYLKHIQYAVYRVDFNYENRQDSFSSFRCGYEIRTERRCSSVDVTLTGPEEDTFKRYKLTYAEAPYSRVSLLARAELIAMGNNQQIEFPPVEFTYSKFDPAKRKLEIFK